MIKLFLLLSIFTIGFNTTAKAFEDSSALVEVNIYSPEFKTTFKKFVFDSFDV